MSIIVAKQRIQYIDALRGFTMFLVVLQHVSAFSFGITPYETLIPQHYYKIFFLST